MSALLDSLRSSKLAADLLTRTNFPHDAPLQCAVSGGADSVALLLLARLHGESVVAWHVDHGLRSGSAAEFTAVRDLAHLLDVHAESRVVTVPDGPNLEARARDARYAVLPVDVLTGHTADDQAETVLINLMRGSATAGLAGMKPDRRPLLRIRRSETVALCAELGLETLDDPMNRDRRFQRVRIREQLIPLLDDISKRDIVEVLTRQAGLLRDDDDLLNELAGGIDATDAMALSRAPIALARRAIRLWLAHPTPPDAATIERVLAVARGETLACEIGEGRQVRRSQQRLEIRSR